MNRKVLLLLTALVLTLSLINIFMIPYMGFGTFGGSHEQSHYINVSWHLWQEGNWIQLHDDAGIYTNKPPLLFWMVNIIWHIFGINNWVFRAIPCVFALGSIGLLFIVFKRLWPEYAKQAWMCPVILLGSWDYLQYIPRFLLDLPLIFFTILAFFGLLTALHKKPRGWVLYGIAIGLGILTKGPVILIFTLPPALLAPFFRLDCFAYAHHNETKLLHDKPRDMTINVFSWFIGLLFSLILASVIVALWLVPLILQTNFAELVRQIFTKSLDLHEAYISKPWWTYFEKLPLALLPWTLWPFLYQSLLQQIKENKYQPDHRFLFILANWIVIFVIMTTIPAKATRYIVPIYFYTVLLFTYSLLHYLPNAKSTKKNIPFFLILLVLAISGLWVGYVQAIPAVVLLCSVIIVWYWSKDTLTSSLLSQLSLMIVIVLLYTLFPVRNAVNAHQMSKFERCVYHYTVKQHRPIAYLYRYGGYQYRIGKEMLPPGQILYNANELSSWQQQYPAGIIVVTKEMTLQNKKILCTTPDMHPIHFIAYGGEVGR